MSAPGDESLDPVGDALIAARLCAIDPDLGGLVLRGGDPSREAVIAALRGALPEGAPMRRIPAHIDDERLLGGIDLGATLARGAAVARAGLLAEADSGVIVVPMAERLSDATAGRIAAVIDTAGIVVERDGVALRRDARFVTVALDDGIEPEERPPAALIERLAFWVDLSEVGTTHSVRAELAEARDAGVAVETRPSTGSARTGVAGTDATTETMSVIASTAAALGIDSARASLFALRAARAAAVLGGRETIAREDVLLAVRLVLAPRATRMPVPSEDPPSDAPPPPSHGDQGEDERADAVPLEDIVLAATLAALPRDVLARIAAGRGRKAARASGAGERRTSATRGRPMGARAGVPGGGARLSLIDTLRAAAPWQKLRGGAARISIRRDDLRVRRFETRAETVTVFAVDASGSAALARLAEAKGAVELLLAEAYVKRAQVALIAFRGEGAALLLPPTRSLARARRALADLPGGGGTPLAAGLNAAHQLAEAARARGRTAFVVVLTDGRANIAIDGRAVRAIAQADAEVAAKAIGTNGIASAFVDISARPRPEGAALAGMMRARYLPLPRADAATMHAAVRAAQDA